MVLTFKFRKTHELVRLYEMACNILTRKGASQVEGGKERFECGKDPCLRVRVKVPQKVESS